MPVLADAGWKPISSDSPWWTLLVRLVPNAHALPGSWSLRGADPDTDPRFDWSWFDSDQVDQLRQELARTKRPVVLRLGNAELQYLPAAKANPNGLRAKLRRFWTIALGILIKFKLVLVFASILISMLAYGLAFGWAYGIGLVCLIAIHESGHLFANRRKGIPGSLPIFIPFLGAFIQLKKFPQSAADEAYIGIMGPIFGLVATLASLAIGLATHDALFLAVAEMGFLLHVFNLMPVLPLDGGRTVGFWRWKAWVPGIVGVLVVLFYNPLTNQFTLDPITLIIVALIFFSLLREPRMHNSQYVNIPSFSRWLYTSVWGLALGISIVGYWLVGTLHVL
jgi:Zn-dependent protease